MNFLLKIVEGPNKGAEIALVEGVAVTLGKGDDCDIILADATLPEVPLKVEATGDSVLVNDESVPPFSVKTVGSTSFAFGPADAPWRELIWPKEGEVEKEPEPAVKEGAPSQVESTETESPEKAEKPAERKSRGGCLVSFIVLLVLLLLLAGLCWRFKDSLAGYCDKKMPGFLSRFGASEESQVVPDETLSSIAERYGLELSEEDGIARISGNLTTRAKRLKATAEAYATSPGVLVDISDDESFRVSADDALFTMTEGALKVVAATNRALVVTGAVRSADVLKKVLSALAADMPKLRDVDVSGVEITSLASPIVEGDSFVEAPAVAPSVKKRSAAAKAQGTPDMPVCGILTTPYPCLVMRDGARVMEGASIGDGVIVKIEADAVTVTNSTGRFTWKP